MNENMICIYQEQLDQMYDYLLIVKYIQFNINDFKYNTVLNLLETFGLRKENYLKYGKVILLISNYVYKYSDKDIVFINLYDILTPAQICYKQEYLRYNIEDLTKLHLSWIKYKENNLKLNCFYNKFVTKEFLEYINYVA